MALVVRVELAFEPGTLGGGRVGGAQLGQAPVELGLHEGGIGQQGGDVAPYDLVEVVGAHRLVVADPASLVAVVVRAQAAVVVDLALRRPGRGAVVGVAAALAGGEAHEQAGSLVLRAAKRRLSARRRAAEREGVLVDDGRHGDGDPLVGRGGRVGVVARHTSVLADGPGG